MAAAFVTRDTLSAAIRDVLAGSDIRCAVAFWGTGAADLLALSRTRNYKVLCDVSLGGTSASALAELGAPTNKRLRHVQNLHAKVYLSDRGGVICSANASANGIGMAGPAKFIEAGTAFGVDEEAFSDASRWFKTLWSASDPVNDDAMRMARERFRPSAGARRGASRPGSLLDLVASDPDKFAEVSFVLVDERSTPAEREQVRSSLIKSHPGEAEAISRLPDTGMFIGWDRDTLARWRRTFVELWIEDGKLYPSGRTVAFYDDRTGSVMSRAYWPALSRVTGLNMPTAKEVAAADREIALRLIEHHGSVLLDARQMAVAVEAST